MPGLLSSRTRLSEDLPASWHEHALLEPSAPECSCVSGRPGTGIWHYVGVGRIGKAGRYCVSCGGRP